jgi:ubiquinone/menaquinone biosynthesis C-methylase UbiE
MLMTRWLAAFLRRYAESEAAVVAPFLKGHRILDLGAGEGYVAAALQHHSKAWVCAVDIGPFGRVECPYVTYDGCRLPFRDGSFDTTLILLALHHCAAPEAVMDEATRVTRLRVIVMESVFRNRRERFWLTLLDERLNRYRHQGHMHIPLAFRRPEEWWQCFTARGLQVVDVRWLGTRWERLVHHPVLYVLDKRDENCSCY